MDEYSVHLPGILTGTKTKSFETFVRSIGEAKSKHEEDKIIQAEVSYLKEQFVSANTSSKKTRELLIRLVYCEMLGHDGSFGYIHAIKFAQQSLLLEKRTGYLATSLFLQKDNELFVLLVNTLQKDLKSTNVVAKSAALDAICKLIGAEMAPALLPLVLAALKDKRAEIRKKSVMTVHQIWRVDHSLIPDIASYLHDLICDHHPTVMAASLHLFYDLIKVDAALYRKYLKAFVQILNQIMDGKLSEYNYHSVQAPWWQMKLLKILALLGKEHKSASDDMSAVLLDMINTLPTDRHIGCAVMLECIRTITTIYPIKSLLDIASTKASLFLNSKSSNLKCLGITAVTSLVEIDLCYATDSQRQQIIIDCLDDDDLTMRKKTLELLYRITSRENVILVCTKLLSYLDSTTDHYIKNEVATKLTELAEKYAPSSIWYIKTMNNVIQVASQCIKPEVIHNLMKLISTVEDDVKRRTISQYIEILNKKCLPDCLVQVACWVIGEFAYLLQDGDYPLQTILSKVAGLLDRKFTDPSTRGWIITAIAKLSTRIGCFSPEARSIIDRYRTGISPELRQRCHEINMLGSDMTLMNHVFPLKSNVEDSKVCSSLSFLDDFVSKSLMNGAQPYQPHIKRNQEIPSKPQEKAEISIEPYAQPFKIPQSAAKENNDTKKDIVQYSDDADLTPSNTQPMSAKNIPKPRALKKLWGPQGYMGAKTKKANELVKDIPNVPKPTTSSSSSSEGSSRKTNVKKKLDTSSRQKTDHKSKEYLTNVLFAGITPPKELADNMTSSSDQDVITSSDDIDNEVTTSSRDHSPLLESASSEPYHLEAPLLTLEDDNRNNTAGIEEANIARNLISSLEGEKVDTGNVDETLHNDVPDTKEQNLLVDFGSDIAERPLQSLSLDMTVETVGGDTLTDIPCPLEDDTTSGNKTSTTTDSGPRTQSVLHKDTSTELCSDSNIRLEYTTVHEPRHLVLDFTLTNHCQSRDMLEKISLTIDPPSNLAVGDNAENNLMVETLTFLDKVDHKLPLICRHPALHMSFKGTVKYTISKTAKVLYFTQEILTKELSRPLNITTEQFGQKWTSMGNDVRQTEIMTSSKKCEHVMDAMAKYMNLAVVDIIGQEGIAAGTILGTGICLVHCTFHKNIDIWIKSTSRLTSDIIIKECALFLKKP